MKLKPVLLNFFSFVAFALIWQILSNIISAPLILPSFTDVARRFFEMAGGAFFWQNSIATFLRVLSAFLISLLLGTILGLLCGISPSFYSFIAFPLSLIKSTPVVSFILIAIFIFKTSAVPVFASVLMTTPVILHSMKSSFHKTDEDEKKLQMAKIYAFTSLQKLKFMLLPKMQVFFLTGTVSSFAMTWKVVAAGEVLSVPKKALGTLLQESQVHLESADLYAVSLALVLMSYAFEKLLSFTLRELFAAVKSTSLKKRKRRIQKIQEDFQKKGHSETYASSELPQNIKNISISGFSLERSGKKLFDNFSIDFEGGKVTGIIAPSGSGKTTLLNHISELFSSTKKISFLFQEPRLLENLTVLENTILPLKNIFDEKTAYERAMYFLSQAGLSEKLFVLPEKLSGGEKQRAAIARAFAFPSEILLLDEAFQSQDLHIKLQLISLLKSLLKNEPKTVVFVTHDPHEATELCDRVMIFSDFQVDKCVDFAIFKESQKKQTEEKIYRIISGEKSE